MIDQQLALDEFIRANDRWLIVVLDACRYDYLSEMIDVEKAYSPALNTPQWINTIWQGQYDGAYVSGTPWILRRYDGYEHWDQIENVWDYGWDDELKTVMPDTLARAVRKTNRDRMVAHFMQPHMPYIAEPRIESRGLGRGPRVENAVEKVGIEKVRDAYRANMRLAVKAADNLVDDFNGPTVLTADHGELLGEKINGEPKYGHNKPDCELLHRVPWRED